MPTKKTQEWFALAKSDLLLVDFLSETSGDRFLSQRAFHCQQAVEKSIKGYLNHNSKKFRKTHDIAELLLLVKTFNPDLSERLKDCIALTDYAIIYRYPDAEMEPLTSEQVKSAHHLAKSTIKLLAELISDD